MRREEGSDIEVTRIALNRCPRCDGQSTRSQRFYRRHGFYRTGGNGRRVQRTRDRHEDKRQRKEKLGYDTRWERDASRSAERDVLELTRQLTIIEARYQRF